jgi:hypothetical protein
MVSADTVWSSGATGIARDTDIAARPRPMANADAAKIFMDVPFLLDCQFQTKGTQRYYGSGLCKKCGNRVAGGLTSDDDANDGDASPNDADAGGASPNGGDASAIAGASDVPTAPVRAPDDRLHPASRRQVPRLRGVAGRGPVAPKPAAAAQPAHSQPARSHLVQRRVSESGGVPWHLLPCGSVEWRREFRCGEMNGR